MGYECVIVITVCLGRDRVAAALAAGLCLGGCVVAVRSTTESCGCLGQVIMSRGEHLVVVGSLGCVAMLYLWSSSLLMQHVANAGPTHTTS